ncbi:hypothetical protein N656DRAFT_699751 [Canariomyces notabilis]|uniref:Uncharacterized protein n=1 Tax=Canariomyces notabilis TaxID=2074819 RepID=A0AAN6TNN4_9PEZI|nr:hypothetical protein N656DRAFT_699751 [Canariomyces arenarius]
MPGGIFFVSWELWQQMTFVLAMGIVAVFCAGLVRLWWNNRLMKKQELLDEEKRARLEQMRKTGLPIKRASEIPFGIRAIQSGVEVEGIWISRPTTPSEALAAKLASDSDSMDGVHSVPTPASRLAQRSKRPLYRTPGVLNEDTLRRLEGQGQSKILYDTYMPTSSRRDPRQHSVRSSASSSGESVDSQPRSAKSISGKSYTSSHSSRLYMPRNPHAGRAGYDAVPRQGPEREVRSPFETPARTHSGFSLFSQSDRHTSLLQSRDVSALEPTFAPGDLHLNKASRRVNDGFEILPAGTFGMLAEMNYADEADQEGHNSRSSNKLRKKAGT